MIEDTVGIARHIRLIQKLVAKVPRIGHTGRQALWFDLELGVLEEGISQDLIAPAVAFRRWHPIHKQGVGDVAGQAPGAGISINHALAGETRIIPHTIADGEFPS